MARLESYEFIDIDLPVTHIQFPLADANQWDLVDLSGAFDMEILAGRVFLNYDTRAICQLVAKELQDDPNVFDYIFYHQIDKDHDWQFKKLAFFVDETKTLRQIMESVQAAWVLSDTEKKELLSIESQQTLSQINLF